jgi:hypothetical protein
VAKAWYTTAAVVSRLMTVYCLRLIIAERSERSDFDIQVLVGVLLNVTSRELRGVMTSLNDI